MTLYAVTVFLSSFLLFQVQPLIGRYILPWFGGGPAVWTTCMLFFQTALLAGYLYAYLAARTTPRLQGYLHGALLAAALLLLPIAPSPLIWKPSPGESPVLKILLLLLANIGGPYLLLSATAPLVQHWFVLAFPGRSPYRLYALSNAGSLLALVSYPFLVEPNITLERQVTAWGWGFVVFVLCCGLCAFSLSRRGVGDTTAATEPAAASDRPGAGPISMWFLLSLCGSAVLLATTNQLCQEVAVVPFLWVAPLALYLVTFIIAFNRQRPYDRVLWGMLMIGALIPACRILHLGINVALPVQVLVCLSTLFTCCMVCHGELARSRPDPRHLTAYYLIIATGGMAGGVFVALLAPALFKGFWEYPLSLAGTCLVVLLAWFRGGAFVDTTRWLPASLVAGLLALFLFVAGYVAGDVSRFLSVSRNFYGVLRVLRFDDTNGERLTLMHGKVMHGTQFTDPGRRRLPTTYYGPESAAGLALRLHPRRFAADPRLRNLRVGVIGLGTGTLAAYGKTGDVFRFYEINPEVIRISDSYFTYRRESAARVEVIPGDARIVMEDELRRGTPQRFDVLIVDAFTSDAIPIHLLTRECFAVYWRHLQPDGLLLLHLTNRFLDLVPVVRAQASPGGERAVLVNSTDDIKAGISRADWMIVTRNRDFLGSSGVREKLAPELATTSAGRLWTDDFASLWQAMK